MIYPNNDERTGKIMKECNRIQLQGNISEF
jgi:hypothetical protein